MVLIGLIRLPMSYHMCTGYAIPANYHSALTEKCDADNDSYDQFIAMLMVILFIVFGFLTTYEKFKRRVQDSSDQTENRSQSARLQVLVDFRTFMSRLVCGIVTSAFITIVYYESNPDDLVKYPGYLFVYAYYFVMLPIMQISQRYLHIIGHPTLKDHLRRRIRDYFTTN